MSAVNESIVEDAALTWFGELGYAIGHGPRLAPGERVAERDSFDDVALAGQLREAIILDFPDLFDPKAVEVARKRLGR